MSMRKKRLYCLIFAFLCISFRLLAQGGSEAASDWPSAMAGDSFSDATPDWPSAAPYPMAGDSERFSAALCSMAAWEAGERDVRDSLLLRRAFFLDRAGESALAYETVCGISLFALDAQRRQEVLRSRLMYAWSAGLASEFGALLAEAGFGSIGGAVADAAPRLKSENLAMILSVLPGAGCAYASNWADAGKYFLINTSVIALGVGAFLSELYAAAFLGSGMILSGTVPRSTELAVRSVSEYNRRAWLEYYRPLYEALAAESADKNVQSVVNK